MALPNYLENRAYEWKYQIRKGLSIQHRKKSRVLQTLRSVDFRVAFSAIECPEKKISQQRLAYLCRIVCSPGLPGYFFWRPKRYTIPALKPRLFCISLP
jgi:hypothetical protein